VASDLETKSNQLSSLHKQLYLFQKHKSGLLTEYYENPSIVVYDPTESLVNYYDLVNIRSRSRRKRREEREEELKLFVNLN
jgi:hypothetical protein